MTMNTIEIHKSYENMTDEELQNELAKINALLGIDNEPENDVDMCTMLCDLADEMIGAGESYLCCEYGIYTGDEIKVTITIEKIGEYCEHQKAVEKEQDALAEWL